VPVAGEVGVTRPGTEAEREAEVREAEGEARQDKGASIREGEGEERAETPAQLKPSDEDKESDRQRNAPQAKPILPRSLGDVVFSGSLASQPASGKQLQDPRDAKGREGRGRRGPNPCPSTCRAQVPKGRYAWRWCTGGNRVCGWK
jgi:hypothetical protein